MLVFEKAEGGVEFIAQIVLQALHINWNQRIAFYFFIAIQAIFLDEALNGEHIISDKKIESFVNPATADNGLKDNFGILTFIWLLEGLNSILFQEGSEFSLHCVFGPCSHEILDKGSQSFSWDSIPLPQP